MQRERGEKAQIAERERDLGNRQLMERLPGLSPLLIDEEDRSKCRRQKGLGQSLLSLLFLILSVLDPLLYFKFLFNQHRNRYLQFDPHLKF